ncbi:MAG: HDOD domain-containing protein [Arcobacteraceae bacterium]|nr:HDOD domain-containing protein [Arcobacteraceae bacterium]
MDTTLADKIDSLPPLPKTILDLEEFKKSTTKSPEDLLIIIEKDPLIVSTLLKVANSAMFGFNSSIETLSRALGLLGVNFTLSIAFGSAIKNSLDTDLKAYDLNSDDFMRISNMASNLISLWISRVDFNLKEELLLPVFLQETGKFIISDLAKEQKKTDDFLKTLRNNSDIPKIEKEFFDITTSQITAAIFKHWKLSDKLISMIEYVDDIDNCPDNYKKEAQILHIAKIACNVMDPLSDKSCEDAIKKAGQFGLNTSALKKAIEKMQDRLLDE